MSKRLTNTEPNPTKRFTTRPTRFKPDPTFRFPSRETSRTKTNEAPISHSAKRNAYDRIKKIQALEREKGSTYSYEELLRQVKNILKEDLEITTLGIFPGDPKNQTGRAILSDGTFFVVFSKIAFRCKYAIKKTFLEMLRDKFLPNITQNKTIFMLFLEDQMEKEEKAQAQRKSEWIQRQTERIRIQLEMQIRREEQKHEKKHEEKKEQKKEQKQEQRKEQKDQKSLEENVEKMASPSVKQNNPPVEKVEKHEEISKSFQDEATMTSYQKDQLIRKSCLKNPIQNGRKSVRWSQVLDCKESEYMNDIIQANKQYIENEKKEKHENDRKQRIAEIKKGQSFLIDFFEINDVYDQSMVDIVGQLDEIDGKYSIMLIKQKVQTPPPSYVKTRSTYIQENEYKKEEEKRKKEVMAIGLLKKMDVREHKINELRDIQNKYPDIFAYVELTSPESLFLGSLPEQSVEGSESSQIQTKEKNI